jgi:hypothetical protein
MFAFILCDSFRFSEGNGHWFLHIHVNESESHEAYDRGYIIDSYVGVRIEEAFHNGYIIRPLATWSDFDFRRLDFSKFDQYVFHPAFAKFVLELLRATNAKMIAAGREGGIVSRYMKKSEEELIGTVTIDGSGRMSVDGYQNSSFINRHEGYEALDEMHRDGSYDWKFEDGLTLPYQELLERASLVRALRELQYEVSAKTEFTSPFELDENDGDASLGYIESLRDQLAFHKKEAEKTLAKLNSIGTPSEATNRMRAKLSALKERAGALGLDLASLV